MKCGCYPRWLTTVSQPINATDAVSEPCPCCGAAAGKRCGSAGYINPKAVSGVQSKERAWVDVCPVRVALLQLKLELTAAHEEDTMRQAT